MPGYYKREIEILGALRGAGEAGLTVSEIAQKIGRSTTIARKWLGIGGYYKGTPTMLVPSGQVIEIDGHPKRYVLRRFRTPATHREG